MKCKYCGVDTEVVIRPEGDPHYAEYRCPKCDSYNGFVPKPKNKDKRRDRNTSWRAKWKEKGFICALCGATEVDYPVSGQWQLDHIVQLCDGGRDEFDNTMMLCTFCHTIKNTEQKRRKSLKKEELECQSSGSVPW